MTFNARCTALSCTLLLGSLAAAPALAQSPEPAAPAAGAMAPIDCSTASAKMASMTGMTMPAMPAGTSVDKTFTATMQVMMEHGHAMAAIEMQCGKDPAARAMAKKVYDDTAEYTKDALDINHRL